MEVTLGETVEIDVYSLNGVKLGNITQVLSGGIYIICKWKETKMMITQDILAVRTAPRL